MGLRPSKVWGYHKAYDAYLSATWELVQTTKQLSNLPPELQAIVERIKQAETTLKTDYSTEPGPPYLVTT